MSRNILLTAFFFIWTHLSVFAQHSVVYESGGELIYEQAAFDVAHYELDLRVDPSDSTIAGTVTMRAQMVHPSNVIVLDLDPRFYIESITETKGESTHHLKFKKRPESKRVRIYFQQTRQPGEKITVSVAYSGKPLVAENAPWDGGFVWERTPSGEPWVGVANQSIGAWVWWPNKDHPSDKPDSVTVNYTMPEDLVVASNGRFRGTTDAGDGWKTWHWFVSMPINNYNVTLNAAPYETITETYQSIAGDEMEITFWILPEYIDQGRKLFPQFSEQIRFLEELLGPYPFRADKYGVAHAPYRGMEHQSLIAYGANFENDNMFGQNAGFDDLHQHELAHEWWGNLVTVWDWKDFWIHEGFGTYMQPLYAEHLKGEAAYREMMELLRTRIVSREELAPYQSKSTVEVYGSGRGGDIYYKGAWFLHTLRYVIGDEYFFKALRRFAYPDPEMESVTDGRHVRHVTTNDFLSLSERISGMNLNWLFDVYLRQPELPRLHETRKDGKLILKWEVPEGFSFPMPVEVKVSGEIIKTVPDKGEIVIEADEDAVIKVDPDHRILKAYPN